MSTVQLQALAEFPVIHIQPVAWGDMDSFGHVNNVVYFRYFENARLAMIQHLEWFRIQTETGVGPIVGSTQARFRRAVKWPDTLHIGAKITDLKEDRFTLVHRIFSEVQQEIVTEGDAVLVGYHYAEKRRANFPEELRQRILLKAEG